MTSADPVVPLDAATLRAPVSVALGTTAEVQAFEAAPLEYRSVNPVSAALLRVRGIASTRDEPREWSMVLKLSRPLSESDAGRAMGHLPAELQARGLEAFRWDREALAYSSPWLSPIRGALRAASCYGVEHRSDGVLLYLEDLGSSPTRWTLADYAVAARHIGRFNGHFARALPADDWLSRGWVATWVALGPYRGFYRALDDESVWANETVRAILPTSARETMRRLAAEAPRRAAACDRLPMTVAHLDAFRANLFIRPSPNDGETVAVDWSFIGLACIGADLAQLVMGSRFYAGDDLDVHAIERSALAAYLEGLREAGWAGGEREVWRGYVDSALARWGFPGNIGSVLAATRAPEERARFEAVARESPERRLRLLLERVAYVVDLAQRADAA